jgi:hypothetical protein
LLALAGKVSSDPIEIILQRPKETAALLQRLNHAPARKIAAAKDRLAAAGPLEFHPLEIVSRENHTAVVGESGSGKPLLTKYLIKSYFQGAHVRVYDSDAAPLPACTSAQRPIRRSRTSRTRCCANSCGGNFNGVSYPCLVDVKGRFYPAHIPDLTDFQ